MPYRTKGPISSRKSRLDRRVVKTQQALHEALIALIREKDYDDIVVQDILDRANIGRSTFYTHYRDKDDLLVTGIHEMIQSVSSATPPAAASWRERLTWFSLPVLEHHDRHRLTAKPATDHRARTVLHERLRTVIATRLHDEIRRGQRGPRPMHQPVPPELLVRYVTSTFILVLNWWLETRSPLRSADVHALFCSLIEPVLQPI